MKILGNNFTLPSYRKVFMIVVTILLWIALSFVVGLNLGFLRQFIPITQSSNQNILGTQHEKTRNSGREKDLQKEYQYWLTVVSDHPDYRDGFVNLAILSYQLGYKEKTDEYLKNVRSLDPNFEGLEELEALQTQ